MKTTIVAAWSRCRFGFPDCKQVEVWRSCLQRTSKGELVGLWSELGLRLAHDVSRLFAFKNAAHIFASLAPHIRQSLFTIEGRVRGED